MTHRRILPRILLLGILLLLCFWASRLIGIGSFPPFLDEVTHIRYTETILNASPLSHTEEGRQFALWWYLLFQSSAAASIWIARVATVLAVLPGVAAVIGIGRLAAGVWGATLAGLFYLFSTYHMFFERMALTDPISASAVSVALYFAYRLTRRVSMKDALVTGLALFVAFGAKVSAIPYLIVPIAAALNLRPVRDSWRKGVPWLSVALATAVGLSTLFILVAVMRGYAPFDRLLDRVNVNPDRTLLETLLSFVPLNRADSLDMLLVYLGPLPATFLLLAVIVLIIRRELYLLLCLFLPLFVFLGSKRQGSRHLIEPMTLLLLCGALVLAYNLQQRNRLVQGLGLGLVFLWGAVQWLPFAVTMARDPFALPYPQRDYIEYVVSDATGFGLREVRDYLQSRDAQEVIGVISNCQGLRYMTLGTLSVTCLPLNPSGDNIAALTDALLARRAPGVYAVLEADNPYIPDTAPGKLLTVIERPGGRADLRIYDLAP